MHVLLGMDSIKSARFVTIVSLHGIGLAASRTAGLSVRPLTMESTVEGPWIWE